MGPQARRRRLHHHGDGRRPPRDRRLRGPTRPARGVRRGLLATVRVQRLGLPHARDLRGPGFHVPPHRATPALAAADPVPRLPDAGGQLEPRTRRSHPGDDSARRPAVDGRPLRRPHRHRVARHARADRGQLDRHRGRHAAGDTDVHGLPGPGGTVQRMRARVHRTPARMRRAEHASAVMPDAVADHARDRPCVRLLPYLETSATSCTLPASGDRPETSRPGSSTTAPSPTPSRAAPASSTSPSARSVLAAPGWYLRRSTTAESPSTSDSAAMER